MSETFSPNLLKPEATEALGFIPLRVRQGQSCSKRKANYVDWLMLWKGLNLPDATKVAEEAYRHVQ